MSNEMSSWAATIVQQKYSHTKEDGTKETWEEIAARVAREVMGSVGAHPDLVNEVAQAIAERKFMPGGRYLYASGRPFHQVQNCLLLRAEDSREGWADLLHKASMALMTGAGIGVDYSAIREKGAPIRKTGGFATGPLALMTMLNEVGRGIRQGGSRRSAIWAGLSWRHPDVHDFISMKNWPEEVKALKEKDFDFPAAMDMTNISVQLDDEFFAAYHDAGHPQHSRAQDVYHHAVLQMLQTGEPGFSVDCGPNAGETLRNACTEVTSADDSDICNLGSVNMARIDSTSEMKRIVELGVMFLMAGTKYSDIPYDKVAEVRSKNRRLGLGLMGVHEWLLKRGKCYEPCEELDEYLRIYAGSGEVAQTVAAWFGLTVPVKTRAIAPTGTIGIVAETTTGIEPIFCAAYKRRYMAGDGWNFQYVLDPTAVRLVKQGVDPRSIEDAYSLAADVERRVAFQAHLQKFVDHSISSTINMPAWGTRYNDSTQVKGFAETLMRYLPQLRGITVYPDGARGGQPLTPVEWDVAARHPGEVFVEQVDVCDLTRGGSCGS